MGAADWEVREDVSASRGQHGLLATVPRESRMWGHAPLWAWGAV